MQFSGNQIISWKVSSLNSSLLKNMTTIKAIRKKSKKVDPRAKQRLIWTVGHGMTFILGSLFMLSFIKSHVLFYRNRSWKTLFLLSKADLKAVTWKNSSWKQYLISLLPQLCYRGSVIGVLLSHGISEYQKWDKYTV